MNKREMDIVIASPPKASTFGGILEEGSEEVYLPDSPVIDQTL
jgi:hypothetical protein